MPDFSYILPAFKAYDIRGQVPDQLNRETAFRIGAAFVKAIEAKKVVIGHDIRLSSPELTEALTEGMVSLGAEVTQIGLCGTEEIYYACGIGDFDGGVMVTASHNPSQYNGIKMVLRGAKPLFQETGLSKIRELVAGDWNPQDDLTAERGQVKEWNLHEEFADYVLRSIDLEAIAKANFKILANCGNGGVKVVLDKLKDKLPAKMVLINEEPDGHFPNGIPNPLLPENRQSTSEGVLKYETDLGVAWDGDFDRCFFFDEKGQFIEGYYLVGLFASRFMLKDSSSTIIYDPRLYWNTREIAQQFGGKAVMSRTGHAFIKQAMRDNNAVYGGEMSAHQYFKDFFYCDSGILPLLMLLELMAKTGQKLSQLVGDRMVRYPVSGEINSQISKPVEEILQNVKNALQEKYGPSLQESRVDGLGLDYANFRLNLRASNTEPLIRLNVETKSDKELL